MIIIDNFQSRLKAKFEEPLRTDVIRACPDTSPIWSEWEDLKERDPWRFEILKFPNRLMQQKPEHRPESPEIDAFLAAMSVEENKFRKQIKPPKKFPFSIELPSRQPDDVLRSSSGSGSRSLTPSTKSGSQSPSTSASPSPKNRTLSHSTSASPSPKNRTLEQRRGSSQKSLSRKFSPETKANQSL